MGSLRNVITRPAARLAAVVCGLAVAVAGCGGPAPSQDQAGTEISGELRMVTPIFEGADGAKALEELLAKFRQKYPEVTVRPDYTSYAKLNEKLTTSIAGGRPYDVMLMGVGWIPPFASKGVLADLGEDPATLADRYNERVLSPGQYEGKVYGLPIMLDTRYGIYRKDLFAQAGLPGPPKNFAELREYAKKLTVRAPDGKLTRAGLDLLSIDLRQGFETLLWANGGELFTADGKPAFNSPQGVGALQLMADVIRTDKSEDFGFTEPGAAAGAPLVQGRAAMMIGHNNTWQQLQENAPDLIKDDKIGFFVLTGVRPAMFQGGTFATVSAKSRNQAAAKELVKFLAAEEAALKANEQRGNVPALKSLADSAYVKGNPAVQFAMRNLGSSFSEGGTADWLEIRGEFKATIESVLLGQKSAQEALDGLAAKAAGGK